MGCGCANRTNMARTEAGYGYQLSGWRDVARAAVQSAAGQAAGDLLGAYENGAGDYTYSEDPWYVEAGRAVWDIFSGRVFSARSPRSGGADPGCPSGPIPNPTPKNSGIDGAPPPFTQKGSPWEDPSPSGTGRLKDDLCDFIPTPVGGRYWLMGAVTPDGDLVPASQVPPEAIVYVEVTPDGDPVAIPGSDWHPSMIGPVGVPPEVTSAGKKVLPLLAVAAVVGAVLRARMS